MMSSHTPAGKLVSAFGDVKAMSALYAPDIEWSLSASLPYPRPMKGFDAVVAFNTSVWSDSYFPDCEVTILDEIGDERSSAVRFIYRARSRASGTWYENEYTLFARGDAKGIREVFEALDTAAVLDQLGGGKVGDTFAKALAH
ncbi:MAG: nuclear transport factor 2 family protein [Parvibaculum sp.]|uniref:nuclear transport factor 2 family protein n=1 Tax=Parvibaculum sp. TaxID=2024848 RepID=UPI00283ED05F|nr:nuclear transport factor 2 family protein [Parvibaculum sp.]MDR3499741.1 nuclear transport factor 2 family protein [Parvibaculum sp.]